MNTISFFEGNVSVLVQSERNKSLRPERISEVEAGSHPAMNLAYPLWSDL